MAKIEGSLKRSSYLFEFFFFIFEKLGEQPTKYIAGKILYYKDCFLLDAITNGNFEKNSQHNIITVTDGLSTDQLIAFEIESFNCIRIETRDHENWIFNQNCGNLRVSLNYNQIIYSLFTLAFLIILFWSLLKMVVVENSTRFFLNFYLFL